ncbi:MAG: ATP-binding cassette, subfamily bacterial [Blastocatellia bacterium]
MVKKISALTRQYFSGWVKVARFTGHFRPLWRKLALANLCGGLSSLLQLTVPLATVLLINDALPNKNLPLLIKVSVGMGLATLGSLIASYLEFYFASVYRERAAIRLGLALFNHIQSQPYLFFKNNESGYIMSRISNDANAALDVVAVMTGVGRSLAWLLSGLILLPAFHTRLGLLVIAVIPIYFYLLLWFNKKTKAAFLVVSEKTATQSRELYESLTGIYETKAYGAQKYRARRYVQAAIEKARILIRARMLMTGGGQVTQIITLLISLFVIAYGGAAVISGTLSLGALVGINTLAAYLLVPINRVVQQSLQIQQALASIERIEQLQSCIGEQDAVRRSSLPRARGHVRYEDVGFAYEGRSPVLNEVGFTVQPGEVILLAGHSGAGKTTLINMLLRFLEPTSGRVLLDGQPISDLPLSYLRSQIALVSQDIFLFSDSIRNNIRIGNLAASDQQITEAARLANALDFIEELPEKFDTQVGERGARLSGGQRQRIAIARALIRNAPILILDEATSAVDQQTEMAVHDALRRLMEGRTTIIIAHHASAFIDYVDRIFSLENARLTIRAAPLVMPAPAANSEMSAAG